MCIKRLIRPGNKRCSRMFFGIQLLFLQVRKGTYLFSFPPRFLSVGGRWQPLDLLGCASTGMFSGDLKQSMTLLPTPGRWAEWVFRFHINLDQQFSTSVLQGFSKHATPDYLVRGFDNCSVRLSKKMTAANTVIGAEVV